MPFGLSLLLLCCIVWFPLVAYLHRLLRAHHPDVYDALGRPTLILNNTVRNGWLFTRWLLAGQFEDIDDRKVVLLCRFLRIFAFAYLALFIAIVIFGFMAAPAHSSP